MQPDSSTPSEAKPRRLSIILGPLVIVAIIAIVFWLPQITSNAAASVNGEVISKSELEQRVAFERVFNSWKGISDPASGAEAARFRSTVLDTMIQDRVVLQEAKKNGITPAAADVSGRIINLTSQFKLSDAQMDADLSKAGLTRQTLETVLQEEAAIDGYVRGFVLQGVAASDQDTATRNWYNSVLTKAYIDKKISSGGARMGQAAPDFVLNDMDGKPLRLSDFKGKPIFLNFFASWCQNCRAEMPDVQATWEANKNKGLIVLEVNLTNQDLVSDVAAFVKEFGLTMPVGLDEKGSVTSLYHVGPIPASYFINRQGILSAVQIGAMSRQMMEQRVAKILQ